MIAEYKRTGEVRPIRFRLTDENGEQQVYNVKKILSKSKEKFEGKVFWKFNIFIEINGFERLCEVRFYLVDMKWVLYKI